MLRFSGILLASLSIALIGFLMCEKLYYRKKQFEALEMFAGICHEEMRAFGTDIFEIFKKYGKRELIFLNQFNKSNIHNSEHVIRILETNGFKTDDAFIVADFFIRLGRGDIKTEEEHCLFFEKKFARVRASAEKDISEKGKLFKSLFMFAGAALFIILI